MVLVVQGMTLRWVFPKIGVPQNGWFIVENLINMDDLGVPLFSETSRCFPFVGFAVAALKSNSLTVGSHSFNLGTFETYFGCGFSATKR